MNIAPITGSGSLVHRAPFLQLAAAKFTPTEKELAEHYLYNYIHGYMTPDQCYPIQESNLYGEKEPWELWKEHQIRSYSEPQEIVYLFTKLKKKSANSKYYERGIANNGGSWHGENSDSDISKFIGSDGSMWTAKKRTFKYMNKKLPEMEEVGKWLMYEFRLVSSVEYETVLCALKNNGSPTVEKELGNSLTRKRKLEDVLLDGVMYNYPVQELAGPALKKLQCYREQSNSVGAVPIMIEMENTMAIVPVQNETTAFLGSGGNDCGLVEFGAEEMQLQETAAYSEVLEEDLYLERLTFTIEELVGGESSVQVAPLIPAEMNSETEQETTMLEADEDDPELGNFAIFLEEQLESSSIESSVEVVPLIPTNMNPETTTLEADEDDPELENFALFLEEALDTEAEAVTDIVHNVVNEEEEEEAPIVNTDTVEPAIRTGKDVVFEGVDHNEKESKEQLQTGDCGGVSMELEQQPWFARLMECTEEDVYHTPMDHNWDCDDLLPLPPMSYVSSCDV
ncbi:hypothetical protein LINGRAHAP2_LOCUS18741 [Linum grandiflorum]